MADATGESGDSPGAFRRLWRAGDRLNPWATGLLMSAGLAGGAALGDPKRGWLGIIVAIPGGIIAGVVQRLRLRGSQKSPWGTSDPDNPWEPNDY